MKKTLSIILLLMFAQTSFASSDLLIQLLEKSKQTRVTEKGIQNDCSLGGSGCTFDSDCCSDNCMSGTCQPGFSCTSGGGSCTFDSDCCDDNCTSGTCGFDGGGCTSEGSCTFDSDCCSGNCTGGSCGISCYQNGTSCTYDMECCGGDCSYGTCGGGWTPTPDPDCK